MTKTQHFLFIFIETPATTFSAELSGAWSTTWYHQCNTANYTTQPHTVGLVSYLEPPRCTIASTSLLVFNAVPDLVWMQPQNSETFRSLRCIPTCCLTVLTFYLIILTFFFQFLNFMLLPLNYDFSSHNFDFFLQFSLIIMIILTFIISILCCNSDFFVLILWFTLSLSFNFLIFFFFSRNGLIHGWFLEVRIIVWHWLKTRWSAFANVKGGKREEERQMDKV